MIKLYKNNTFKEILNNIIQRKINEKFLNDNSYLFIFDSLNIIINILFLLKFIFNNYKIIN